MNALVKKEIRLLLPSWIAALLLAVAPPWLYKGWGGDAGTVFMMLLWAGTVFLVVSAFGREFSLGTFSLLLAQPVPRTRIWRTKVCLLAPALITVFGVYVLNLWCAAAGSDFHWQTLLFEGVLVLAAYSSGLWSTLLFRQVAAAFWIALLVPMALWGGTLLSLRQNCSHDVVRVTVFTVLGLYAIAGFWWARRLFLRAQDVAWTGGKVMLPAWPFFRARSGSFVEARRRKPITALFWKELQLHQLTLVCAGAMLALHAVNILMRMARHRSAVAPASLDMEELWQILVWLGWMVMPVLVGCTAAAEERKLGVAEGQLCLPVSSRVQFAIKFLVAVVLGVLLGGLLPCLMEGCAIALGAPSILNEGDTALKVCLAIVAYLLGLTAVASIAFFASTLARDFLQALAIAVVVIVGCAAFIVFVSTPQTAFGATLWRDFLADVIGIPTMMIVLLWLAYRNFKEFDESRRVWRRNLLGLTAALAFVVVASAALYNRIWEVFTPLEPMHGRAQLTLSNPPRMRCERDGNLTIMLPDGRVWVDRIACSWQDKVDNPAYPSWQPALARVLYPLPGSLGPHQFIGGSNWVDVTARWYAIIGIRSDGSLWIAEKTNRAAWRSPELARFGDETNWQAAAQHQWPPLALLLKKDGTLWWWGTNYWETISKEGPRWLGLHDCKPYRVGTNSDWTQVFSFSDVYARKNDGTVWTVKSNDLVQTTTFGQTKWRNLVSGWNSCLYGVRDDGTLWICPQVWTNSHWVASEMVQVGRETDWAATAASIQCLVALKSDGSLWKWDVFWKWDMYRMVTSKGSPWKSPSVIANTTPTRLGIHNDWVAVAKHRDGVIPLAADGSLWYWPDKDSLEEPTPLLRPPRKPQLLANIFGPSK